MLINLFFGKCDSGVDVMYVKYTIGGDLDKVMSLKLTS